MNASKTPKKNRQSWGYKMEEKALCYLQQQGYTKVAQNYRCPQGEIDLIVSGPEYQLLFVEVKARSKNSLASPESSFTPHKRLKILQTAYHFLHQNPRYRSFQPQIALLAYQEGRTPPWRFYPTSSL